MGGRAVALAGVVLAIATSVAACGEEGRDATASPAAKAAFIEKLDAVCLQGNKRMERGLTELLKSGAELTRLSTADYEELVGGVIVPSIRREIEEIEALEPPSGDEERIEAIVDALEDGVETAEDNPEAAAKSGEAVFGISSRLAKEYGLEVCSTR